MNNEEFNTARLAYLLEFFGMTKLASVMKRGLSVLSIPLIEDDGDRFSTLDIVKPDRALKYCEYLLELYPLYLEFEPSNDVLMYGMKSLYRNILFYAPSNHNLPDNVY